MKIILQRVKKASVSVDEKEISAIGPGLLLLVGIGKDDTSEQTARMADKISKIRVFEDEQGKMNLDIREIVAKILSVPQFTLLARTDKGNRPGFDDAADPGTAEKLWQKFNEHLRSKGITVEEGRFGVHMEVSLVNNGPVTLVLEG